MVQYEARFERGSQVRIGSAEELNQFRLNWKYHNPLTDDQMRYAGEFTVVRDVGFYHGGDPLYQLDGIPGVWHEQCLRLRAAG